MTQNLPKPLTPEQSRVALGLSQIEAAERCKVSRRTWQSWEATGEIPKSKREFVVAVMTPTAVERPRFLEVVESGFKPLPKASAKPPYIPPQPEPERYRGMTYENGVHKRWIDGDWRVVPFPPAREFTKAELDKLLADTARALRG